ncbi:MAG: DEAD/DEAH box helicase, partial [Zestosphaera sp.]
MIEWFKSRFGEFTPPQLMAIPKIKEGRNVLISSPTGTGKTLAVFLPVIDELLGDAELGLLEDYVYVVYVSPLRALNNDMRKNLIQPVLEIREYALKK